MRTTLSISDALLERAKKEAAARHQTLGQYVEDALQQRFVVSAKPDHSPVRLPVAPRRRGVEPRVDLTSNRALFDAIDDTTSA